MNVLFNAEGSCDTIFAMTKCQCDGRNCKLVLGDPRHGSNGGYSNNGCRCGDCKLAMRTYQAAYYAKNRQNMIDKSSRWVKNNPERYRRQQREYYASNRDRKREYSKKYYQENSDRIKKNVASRKKRNPAREREYNRTWRTKPENRDNQRARVQRRYARKIAAECGCVTSETYRQVIELNGGKCSYCPNGLAEAFEHVVPLKNGGKNCVANGLPSCRECNSSKGVKELHEWLEQTGRSLQYPGDRLTCPINPE